MINVCLEYWPKKRKTELTEGVLTYQNLVCVSHKPTIYTRLSEDMSLYPIITRLYSQDLPPLSLPPFYSLSALFCSVSLSLGFCNFHLVTACWLFLRWKRTLVGVVLRSFRAPGPQILCSLGFAHQHQVNDCHPLMI
jgi:hypothetical protein